MSAKKKTQSKQQDKRLALTNAEVVEAAKDVIGSDHDRDGTLRHEHFYYTSDAVVIVAFEKYAVVDSGRSDPREP